MALPIEQHVDAAVRASPRPQCVMRGLDPRIHRPQQRTNGLLSGLGCLVCHVGFSLTRTEERAALAAKLKPESYDKGDTLVKPGVLLQSLFIVGSGVRRGLLTAGSSIDWDTREGVHGE